MGTVLNESSQSIEDILVQTLKKSLTFHQKIHVFGVVCVTSDDKENTSITVKLNREISNERATGIEDNLVHKVRNSFRKRSHSADSRWNISRKSRFEPYVPQRTYPNSDHPNNTSTSLLQSPVCGSKNIAQNGNVLSAKRMVSSVPVNTSNNTGIKEHSNVISKYSSVSEDAEKTFKAGATDPSHRQLLEKTLKEFIKVKYQQSLNVDKSVTKPVNNKVSPVAQDFIKMLSLQARIMGVSVPNLSPHQLQDPIKNEKDELGTSTENMVTSQSKCNLRENVGITKSKRLSFNSPKSDYDLQQGKFKQVIQKRLEDDESSVSTDSNLNENRSISVNIPPVADKKAKRDDKRKQVLKRQHALRVSKDKYLSHSAEDIFNTTLPFSTDFNIKEEEQDDIPYNEDITVDIKTENDESCPNGSNHSLLSPNISKSNSEVLSPSISIPPSSYVFKPIVISPSSEHLNDSRTVHLDNSKTITDDDRLCVEDNDESLSHLCVGDITSEHSFVPRESLSSLQVDDGESPEHNENEYLLQHLPFSDIDNIPDVINSENNPLNHCMVNEPVENTTLTNSMSTKLTDSVQHVQSLHIINEDSNTSVGSISSIGFDVLHESVSPSKTQWSQVSDSLPSESTIEKCVSDSDSSDICDNKCAYIGKESKHVEKFGLKEHCLKDINLCTEEKTSLSLKVVNNVSSTGSDKVKLYGIALSDHNYTVNGAKPLVNYSSETVSSAKKCRKPVHTRKFFPLKAYVSDKPKNNIETEVISMDDAFVISEMDVPVQCTKVSKRRYISVDNDFVGTPSKRIKQDSSQKISADNDNTCTPKRIKQDSSQKIRHISTDIESSNRSFKTVKKDGSITKVLHNSNKSLHVLPKVVKTDTPLRNSQKKKKQCFVEASKSHTLSDPSNISSEPNFIVHDKTSAEKTSPKVAYNAAVIKEINCDEKVKQIEGQYKQKPSVNILKKVDTCSENNMLNKSEKEISCYGGKENSTFDSSEVSNPKGKRSIKKAKINVKKDSKYNFNDTTGISNVKSVSTYKTNDNRLQLEKSNLEVKHQHPLNDVKIKPVKCVSNTACVSQVTAGGKSINHTDNPQSIIVSLPFDIVGLKKIKKLQEKVVINKIRGNENQKCFEMGVKSYSNEESKVISNEQKIKCLHIPVINDKHQASHGHLLVRPIPTVHSGNAVKPKVKHVIKSDHEHTHKHDTNVRVDQIVVSKVNIDGEETNQLKIKEQETNQLKIKEQSTDKLVDHEPSHNKNEQSDPVTTKVRKKHKRKSSNKKRKSSPTYIQNIDKNSNIKSINSTLVTSEVTGDMGDLLIQKEYLRPNLNLGKGRLGRRRPENPKSEGFKMKKHWLEMWGPCSPKSPHGSPPYYYPSTNNTEKSKQAENTK